VLVAVFDGIALVDVLKAVFARLRPIGLSRRAGLYRKLSQRP
jgi:hypothetical protein